MAVLEYSANGTSGWSEPIAPQTMDILYQDVDYDSGRTANADMHRNKIGLKRKLALSYPPMSYDNAANILNLVVSDTVDSFYVRYIDPVNSLTTPKVLHVYVGDRTAPVYSAGRKMFNAMSFDLIEV